MSDDDTKVYTPISIVREPGRMFLSMTRDLLSSGELSWQLAVSNIRAQYRQAALGLLWAFLVPAANTAVWLFVHASGIVRVQNTGISYPAFVISGTLLWSIFMDAISAPLLNASSARQMLAKINFPREALILSGVLQTMFNAAIKLIVLAVALSVLGLPPSWTFILLPFAVMGLVLLGTALGLLLTPIGLLFSDIGRGLPLVLQFLMFVSPVVYPMPRLGWAGTVLALNPISPLLTLCRQLATDQPPQQLAAFFLVVLASLALLVFAWVIFRAAMPVLIERMSA